MPGCGIFKLSFPTHMNFVNPALAKQTFINKSGAIVKHIILKLAAFSLACSAALAYANDVNVGVTVSGEVAPGVYGRVNVNNNPPPVLYAQPVTVIHQTRYVNAAPIYMHVPPGHAKKWSKHCHEYNACAQPVYFVRSEEYREQESHHDKHYDKHHDKHHGKHHGD
jgi:hypothetical protein